MRGPRTANDCSPMRQLAQWGRQRNPENSWAWISAPTSCASPQPQISRTSIDARLNYAQVNQRGRQKAKLLGRTIVSIHVDERTFCQHK